MGEPSLKLTLGGKQPFGLGELGGQPTMAMPKREKKVAWKYVLKVNGSSPPWMNNRKGGSKKKTVNTQCIKVVRKTKNSNI